jgi:hypothetical protein
MPRRLLKLRERSEQSALQLGHHAFGHGNRHELARVPDAFVADLTIR